MYCMAWKISPLSFWRWCLNCRQRSVRSVAILILPIFQSARPLWVRAKWKRKLIGPLWKDTINLIMIHRGCHNGMLVASIIICLLQKKNTSCVIGQVSQLSYLVDYKIFVGLYLVYMSCRKYFWSVVFSMYCPTWICQAIQKMSSDLENIFSKSLGLTQETWKIYFPGH